jgi:hypothetical protein
MSFCFPTLILSVSFALFLSELLRGCIQFPVFMPPHIPARTFSFSASRGECCARFVLCVRRSGSNSIVCKIKITGECSFVHKRAHNLYLHTHTHSPEHRLHVLSMYRGGTSAYVIDSALGHISLFESRAAIRSLKKPPSTPQSAHCVCVFSPADVIDCPMRRT